MYTFIITNCTDTQYILSSTSAKYSHPSQVKGTRFMLVSKVALGKCKDYYSYQKELEGPPEGYQSTHGVRAEEGVASQFKVQYIFFCTTLFEWNATKVMYKLNTFVLSNMNMCF